MEQKMRRMKLTYNETIVQVETGYKKLEAKSWERYNRNMKDWRIKAKERLGMYKSSLKQAIEDREYVEQLLKEKLEEQKLKFEQLKQEKKFLQGEFENWGDDL